MAKLVLKINLIIIMVLSLLLTGIIGSIAHNIELTVNERRDFQVHSLDSPRDSENIPFHEEIRTKVEEITSYIEHEPITIDGNIDFNDTAYQEGWPGNGSINDPYIIQGLNITGPSGSYLINIQNTNVYFQINDSLLASGSRGIHLQDVENGLISNNTLISNSIGIYITSSSNNNTFFNNTVSDNQDGFWLTGWGTKNSFLNNSISNNARYGFYISGSAGNTIINNNFVNDGLYFNPIIDLSGYHQLEVTNNFVNGKPLVFWQDINGGSQGVLVPTGAGQIILVNSYSIIVTDQNLSYTCVGLQAAYCWNLTVSNINASYNSRSGILLVSSTESTLYNNTATYNGYAGIWQTYNSYDNSICRNALIHNYWGIFAEGSSTILVGNIVSYNVFGIRISDVGSVLLSNIISNSINYGIILSNVANAVISGNMVSNNDNYGIYFIRSGNNLITRNDFSNNYPGGSSQGSDADNWGLANTFENNYWNDWTTPDVDSDGIVDSPYLIDGNSKSQDSHPLTTPVHLSSPTVLFPNGGTTLNGIVTIEWSPAIDQWGYMVNYTIYYSNDSGSTWISLVSDLSTTSYQWDTTTVPDGTEYLVKVVATCTVDLSAEDVSNSIFTIQNAVVTISNSPQGLTATTGELFVYLTWTAPSSDGGSAITGYRVYRGTSSGEFSLIYITMDTSVNDTLVTGDITYYYVVTAVNSVGESLSSNEVTGTPLLPPVPTLTSTIIIETSIIYKTTWVTQTKSTTEFATLAILAGFLGVLWLKRRKIK